MARAHNILARFPAHLEATKPGKVLGTAVEGLARDLDVQSAALARIRRAHRLLEADEWADLLLLAARHGIGEPALALLTLRFERAADRLADLDSAADPAGRNEAAAQLLDLWSIDGAAPRLARFADPPPGPDPVDLEGPAGEIAADRLRVAAKRAQRRRELIAAARTRVATAIRIHAGGNGTVRALLDGAANALDLDLDGVRSSDDRYVHAGFAFDRLRLRADTDNGPIVPSPGREVIGLVENPLYRVDTDAAPRRHAERFDQLRRGFERATLRVRITGEGARTIGPMVVNRDEGHGVGYTWPVSGGETLVFEEGGRVRLGHDDVTPYAFAWRGACFADRDTPHDNDYRFAEGAEDSGARGATFAVGVPEGALDPDFAFPHAGDSLPMPGVAVGRTRLAFFVQEAHISHGAGSPPVPEGRRVPPRPAVGFLDGSVFAASTGEARDSSALVSLSWLERKAHAVRVVVPPRFRNLEDDPEAPEVRRRLTQTLGRFKPAGVALEVTFLDDQWILGQGVLDTADADNPVAALRGGTVLWPAPESEGA